MIAPQRPHGPVPPLVHAQGRWLAWPGSAIQVMAFDELLATGSAPAFKQAAGVRQKKMSGAWPS